MKQKIRVIQYGVGVHGSIMAALALRKPGMEIVGAIDIAEEMVGKDLGEVLGMDKEVGVKVSNDPDAVFSTVKADIVLHATVSFLREVWSQIVKPVEAGINVITIAPDMGYPYARYAELAKEIDEKAKMVGVTVLGTGVNPGFAMDWLPLALSGICHEVSKIKVTRLVDVSKTGAGFLKGVGIGMTIDEFNKGKANGSVTLDFVSSESMSMVADSLGWKLDEMKKTAEAVISEKYIETPNIKIEPGRVCGHRERLHGIKNGKELITLEAQAGVGLELEAKNTISIEGDPNITETMTVQGTPGGPAIAVNMIPHVINAKPGLLTMKDMPIAPCLLRDVRDLLL